jgi:hypothetical protein
MEKPSYPGKCSTAARDIETRRLKHTKLPGEASEMKLNNLLIELLGSGQVNYKCSPATI